MAISTFFGLHTALRGILAQQRSLDTTTHNIANANTVGYSRQEALLEASPAFSYPGMNTPAGAGQIGTGVDIAQYKRVRDAFIDVQLRAQTMRRGFHQTTSDGLDQVELAFAEPGETGLNTLLSKFWDSWQDVSNAPENLATRQALVQAAASLAEGFRSLDSQLATIATQSGTDFTLTMDEVNSIGAQILDLNVQIANVRAIGDQPNDLFDKRDLLLDRLAELGNVTVTSGPLDVIDVTIGGATLVTGATSAATLAEVDLTSLTSGKLAALRTLRDTTLPGYRASLDAVVSSLVTQVNAFHTAGFDLAGNTGQTFFAAGGTTAATIAIDPTVLADPSLVATSIGAGQPGNAAVALQIGGLRAATGIDVAYQQLVTRLGADGLESQRALANAELLTNALHDRRDAFSGVSMDEEMSNLIRFQRGFQASARALNAMDEMIDMLINRTGRVGL
jgi:flagellar hook-associated protein 1